VPAVHATLSAGFAEATSRDRVAPEAHAQSAASETTSAAFIVRSPNCGCNTLPKPLAIEKKSSVRSSYGFAFAGAACTSGFRLRESNDNFQREES
jgi:hypothetical protein